MVVAKKVDDVTPTPETPVPLEGLNIYQIIPLIRKEVGAVRKDLQPTAGVKFNYRSADQVINALVPAMNKYGVFTTVEDFDYERTEHPAPNSKVVTVVTFKKRVTFYAPDGSNVSSVVASENSDYADKATGGASTYAYRYALLQTFTLPTDEDDPDSKRIERESVPTPAAIIPTSPVPASKVKELQAQIKAAAGERDLSGKEYTALGNKLFGDGWATDEKKLAGLLKAIVDGETI